MYQTSPKLFQNDPFLANCDAFAPNDKKMCETRQKKSYKSMKRCNNGQLLAVGKNS